jgi:hypothetical protein
MAFMWAFMTAIRANEESVMKSRRQKAAWENKRATRCEAILTARAPSWLKLTGRRPNRRFEIIEDRAAVVRRIYEMSLQGIGQNRIAELLNQDGVPLFNRSKGWHPSFVMRLLHSEAVIGTYLPHILQPTKTSRKNRKPVGRIEGYFPAIIDRKTFSDVQTMCLAKTGSGRQIVRATTRNVVAGVGQCVRCGCHLKLVSKGLKYRYLVCSRALAGPGCPYISVRHELVECALMQDGPHWRPDQSILLTTMSRETMVPTDDQKNFEVVASRLDRLHSARREGCVWAFNAALRMLLNHIIIDPENRTLELFWRYGAVTITSFVRTR